MVVLTLYKYLHVSCEGTSQGGVLRLAGDGLQVVQGGGAEPVLLILFVDSVLLL